MSPAPVKEKPQAPPEERFWKHYSPHGEAPLSVAGSFAAHAIGIGGLILVAVYLAALFVKPTRSVPVEPVRVFERPGGGGSRTGGGGAGGAAAAAKMEDTGTSQEELPRELQEEPRRPALNEAEKSQIAEKFDTESTRFIEQSNSEASKAFARLSDGVRKKLGAGQDKGKGGTGTGGGQGTGQGKGVGDGKGDARMALTKREKRMLRWHMRFTANSGEEYLQQLKGLGAILAFPLGDENDPTFHVVRDLRPGAKATPEDVAKLNRIYWIDDKPRSVQDILRALRLQLPGMPSRFVAFMPEALEKRLFDMERRYVERVLRRRFDEDAIMETTFRCVLTGNGFQPELINVSIR
ncbi:MAG: hypothetical protein U0797_19180 [Gemmataceae bacterium]